MKLIVKEYNYETKVGRYIGYYYNDRCIHGQFMSVETGWENTEVLHKLLFEELRRITFLEFDITEVDLKDVLYYFVKCIRIDNVESVEQEIYIYER